MRFDDSGAPENNVRVFMQRRQKLHHYVAVCPRKTEIVEITPAIRIFD